MPSMSQANTKHTSHTAKIRQLRSLSNTALSPAPLLPMHTFLPVPLFHLCQCMLPAPPSPCKVPNAASQEEKADRMLARQRQTKCKSCAQGGLRRKYGE